MSEQDITSARQVLIAKLEAMGHLRSYDSSDKSTVEISDESIVRALHHHLWVQLGSDAVRVAMMLLQKAEL